VALGFDCPHCGSALVFRFLVPGERGKCTECGVEVQIPADATETDAPPSHEPGRPLPPAPPAGEPPIPPPVWGPWATLGFLVLLGALSGLILYFVLLALLPEAIPDRGEKFVPDGEILIFSALTALLLWPPLLWAFCLLRRGIGARSYLGLRLPTASGFVGWTVTSAGLSLLLFIVLNGLPEEVPRIGGYWSGVVQTTDSPVLLWICATLVVPFAEELVFRGFAYQGFLGTRLGAGGAIVIASLLFTLLHTQYGWPELAAVFVGGLLFGVARWRTGSVITAVGAHAAWNAVQFAWLYLA